jgi:hypothetical protein
VGSLDSAGLGSSVLLQDVNANASTNANAIKAKIVFFMFLNFLLIIKFGGEDIKR